MMTTMQRLGASVVAAVLCAGYAGTASAKSSKLNKAISIVKADFANKSFRFEPAKGLGKTNGITRRDPSDVIKVGDTCFVWYTRVDQNKLPADLKRLRTSGYVGTIWYAISKDDGHSWTECGEALGKGRPDAFDSFAVFTPNIVKFNGRYWLYYTGVKPTPGRKIFENNSTNDFTAIGVAVADSPHGPFRRIANEPILRPRPNSDDPARPSPFDSYRVDDAALLVRDYDGDGDLDIWLYYKGRNIDYGRAGPGKTEMGLAVADEPQGPYIRVNSGRPILAHSHEVMIWPHRAGVAAYASASGTLEFAPDGVDFMTNPINALTLPRPKAPGCFRPDLTNPVAFGRGIAWGICMEDPSGPSPYLLRYEINLTVSD
jgi:Glycosyl hydrolases family 43